MSEERVNKYQWIVSGYIRQISKRCLLDIPSEIISIIFMFYYIKLFDFECGQDIEVEDNVIRNLDKTWWASLNTTVIGDWMDLSSNDIHSYTIKMKMINISKEITIGIVQEGYHLNSTIADCEGTYCWSSNGYVIYNYGSTPSAEPYTTGDEVCMTLDVKELSLWYKIVNSDNNISTGFLFVGPHKVDKEKYKWGISLDTNQDSCEILNIYSS